MKKLFALTLAILSCGVCYALPLGNPTEASLLYDGLFIEGPCNDFCESSNSWCDGISMRIGYYGDFVFNRHLRIDDHNVHESIEDTELFTNAAYLALNFFNKADIFATLGGTNFYLLANAANFNTTGGNGDAFILETETDFSWSVGGRVTVWSCGCTELGFVGQYFYTRPDIERISIAEATSIYTDPTLTVKYYEWQIGLGASHRVWNFVPYIGVKLAGAKVDLDNASVTIGSGGAAVSFRLRNLKNRFHAGYVVGVSLVDCEKIALTIEARYPDEKALYVNGQIRF